MQIFLLNQQSTPENTVDQSKDEHNFFFFYHFFFLARKGNYFQKTPEHHPGYDGVAFVAIILLFKQKLTS